MALSARESNFNSAFFPLFYFYSHSRTFDNFSNNRMNNVQAQRGPSGPFRLDEGLIAEIEHNWVRSEKTHLAELRPIDLGFLDEPIKIKPYNGVSYPAEKLALLLTKSPTRPQSASVQHQTTCSPHHLFSSPQLRPSTAPAQMNELNFEAPKLDAKLTNMIKGIGHPDRLVAHASLNELSDILDSPEKQAVLRDYEEIYIASVLDQFKVSCDVCGEIMSKLKNIN
jgi:cytoskeleton-associated protein 5